MTGEIQVAIVPPRTDPLWPRIALAVAVTAVLLLAPHCANHDPAIDGPATGVQSSVSAEVTP